MKEMKELTNKPTKPPKKSVQSALKQRSKIKRNLLNP